MTSTATQPANDLARNEKGQFAPGNAGGRRLPRVTEMKYVDATMSLCTVEVWKQIVQKAIDDALTGALKARMAARTFLAKYVMPPPERIHATQVNVNVGGGQGGAPMPAAHEIDAAIQHRVAEILQENGVVIDVASQTKAGS